MIRAWRFEWIWPARPKESVDLYVGDKGFCVKAEGEGFGYENCGMLAREVKREEAKAKFNSGLLN